MQQSRHLVLVASILTIAAAPPPPAKYDVQIRYKIDVLGKDRVDQYLDMVDFFKRAGFVRAAEPPPEDTEAEDHRNPPINGTIASERARLLLRQPRVQVLRLLPEGKALPAKAQMVRVHLELSSGFDTARQMLLANQVRSVLREIGFQEGALYNHLGYTRLVGALPAGQIDTILNDLRKTPKGADQPAPFRSGPPVRVVEILPDVAILAARPPLPPVPPELDKVNAELRPIASDKENAKVPLRFEILLALSPPANDRTWMQPLRKAAPTIALEGRVGQLVTAVAQRGELAALAALPGVAALRLPRPPRPLFPINGQLPEPAPLAADGPVQHRLQGKLPQGYRAAIVDADFRGWEALQEAFPKARLHILDLTRERNSALIVEPYPFRGPGPGQGTRFAQTLLRASPSADVTLIVVDPAAPYQLETVARAIAGERVTSLALEQRLADLNRNRAELDIQAGLLAMERRKVFLDFRLEPEAEQARKNYRQRQADHDCLEALWKTALKRYTQLTEDLRNLKGTRLVLTGLVWDDGHPVEGASELSRYFDDRAFKGAMWFQYTGDTRGQAWMGLFTDKDRNDVMEFAPPEAKLPPNGWTRELNFLAWRNAKGEQTAELPAGALLRVTVQWREAHEPDLLRTGEDPYREPLANLGITLAYQSDPTGTKQPDDDMEIAAESYGPATRLAKTLNAGVYEQSIVFRVVRPGRYALRITGRAPTDTRPPGVPSVPAARRTFELWPRVFVTTLEGDGRAVLADYSTAKGTLGTPADAKRVERVGER